MSRNKKPRNKAYKPKPVNKDAHNTALKGTRQFTEKEKAVLLKPAEDAVEALKRGELDRTKWTIIAGMLNTAVCLGGEGVGPNFKPVHDATIQAMMELRQRLIEHGKAEPYPAQVLQVEESLFLFKTQLDLCTYRDWFRAEEKIQYRAVATPQNPEDTRTSYVQLDVDTVRTIEV